MNFRKTTKSDLSFVTAIFAEARESMKEQKIDQWQNGYPSESDIMADIAQGISYVLCDDDGTVVASCAIIQTGEPTYTEIRAGAWLTDSTDDEKAAYTAVHRVATARSARGKGLASRMLCEAAILARKEGKRSLRIDTHKDNSPMQRMLSRNGFTYCGEITLKSGEGRIAFEKYL